MVSMSCSDVNRLFKRLYREMFVEVPENVLNESDDKDGDSSGG